MSLEALMTRTVEISRRSQTGPPDDDNVPTTETTTASTVGYLEPTRGIEATGDRQTTIGDFILFLPADTAVDASDEVVIEGTTYRIVAPPNRFNAPRGEHHVELALEVSEG